MKNINYSITGNPEMDCILEFLSGDSKEDQDHRWLFNIGDIVIVEKPAGGSSVKGTIAQVRGRRNGYPEPFFHGFWFPLLYLEHLDENPGGGELIQECCRLATKDEKAKFQK